MSVDNLYVTYDEGGTIHFHVNDVEVDEQAWKLRHPMMKEDKGNGGNLIGSGGRRVGNGGVTADGPDAKEQRRQGVRDYRDRVKAQGRSDFEDGAAGA